MTRKLFAGAHQSRIDVDTAAKVIGYSNSSSGAAASALGALRQYGLVDGLRGDMGVSDLAMRILQPMSEAERTEATREAALKPEMFERVFAQFGGRFPSSDEPVRAFLIRQEGFSAGGAEELIGVLRDTLNALPEPVSSSLDDEVRAPRVAEDEAAENSALRPGPHSYSPSASARSAEGELIALPLGANCRAEVRLIGEVSAAAYARLIKHLDLLKETLVDDG